MVYDTFKSFAYEMFMKHRDECKWYRIPCKYQTFGHYFRKNKWFIKKQFKKAKSSL